MRNTPPESPSGDQAAEHARLTLEVQRLRLECTGLRHDNTAVTRERDSLLKENIALRKEDSRDRQREAALAGRDHSRDIELGSLRGQLRHAQLRISILELDLSLLRMDAHNPGATVPKREIARQLRDLLQLCHPDKWQDAAVATELTKHLNTLRAAYLE